MDGLTPEQQALFASIMGNSSQTQALNPQVAPAPAAAPAQTFAFGGAAAPAPAPAPAAPAGGDSNRVLSQAEIDALIASMGN